VIFGDDYHPVRPDKVDGIVGIRPSIKANPVRAGDAKPRGPRGQPGYRTAKVSLMPIETGLPPTQGTAVVIEDDVDIRNIVCAVLRQAGFDVHSSATGQEGVEAVRSTTPTVVTLDVGLPDIDGYEVLRRIRTIDNCYVIMLTARSDELDTLTALQCGADDYLVKPFRPRELRARIDAMLRRPRTGTARSTQAPESPAPSAPAPALTPSIRNATVLNRGDLVLDSETRTIRVSGQEVLLTKSEFDLLHDLLRSNGTVRTKSALVGVLRGEDHEGYFYVSDADHRTIEVHLGNLRRKLSPHLGGAELITTVRGVGYRIAPLPPKGPQL
jgi:DNA-binding response OmpR family regulator